MNIAARPPKGEPYRVSGDIPALAAFAYTLALWFNFRLVRAITRSGRL